MSRRREERRNDRDSEFEDYIYKYYKDLKDGRDRVTVSDKTFECPYCYDYDYEKKQYAFHEIVSHASRIGRESKSASYRSRARHLGLERYLKRCFDKTTKTSRSRTEHYQEDDSEKQITLPAIPNKAVDNNVVTSREPEKYGRDLKHGPQSLAPKSFEHIKDGAGEERIVCPWMAIIANIPVVLIDGRYVGDSGRKMKEEWALQGYNPTKIHPLWNRGGHTGYAIAEFSKDWNGFNNAMAFTKKFEMDNLGKRDWYSARPRGDKLYAWIAREEEYKRKDDIGKYLRKNADIKTISEIEKENKVKETKLVGSLTNALSMKDKQCEEIKKNISRTETNMANVMRQKEETEKAYNEELQMKAKQQSDDLKRIYSEHERTKSKLEADREELRSYEKGLKKREYLNESERRRLDQLKIKNEKAIVEQKKAEESMMKLAEAQKKQKHQLRQKIIELEKKLNDKQRLELEIEQMKGAVEVMKHFSEDGDVKEKIKSIEENLKEKEEDLENLEELNQALIIKERKTNDEVQDARKELINGLKDRPSANASVGVKRMGDLDEKPILAAAKKKYPAAEAGDKAMEFASILDKKLRDPSWHPFQVIMVGEDHKEVIDEEDDCLKTIKTEWDDEVYKAVVTALTEMNQYNPSGRYPVPELWKSKEGKRATLGDSVDFILRLWKTNKRKRN